MASGHSKGALDKPSLLLASSSDSTPSVSLQALLCWFGHPKSRGRPPRATSEGGQCEEEWPRATGALDKPSLLLASLSESSPSVSLSKLSSAGLATPIPERKTSERPHHLGAAGSVRRIE